MPSFQQPPDWWVSLANLTQWVYWPAVSSILSFAAIIFTIRLADRGRRESKRKDAAFLRSVAYLLHGVNGVAEAGITNIWFTGRLDASALGMHRSFEKTKIADHVGEIQLTDFPDEDSLHVFLVGRLALLLMVKECADAVKENKTINYDSIIAEAIDVDRSVYSLRVMADRYSKRRGGEIPLSVYKFSPPKPEVNLHRRRAMFWGR